MTAAAEHKSAAARRAAAAKQQIADRVQTVHGSRSDSSWHRIRQQLRQHYRSRTGSHPSADTLQQLLISFLLRIKSDRDLQPDRFAISIWRVVGDVIVDKIEADSDRRRELDAAGTYAELNAVGCLLPTWTKTAWHNGRNEAENNALKMLKSQLQLEADGVIEIYRPEMDADIRFA